MMDEKLQYAADHLPDPRSDFSAVEEKASHAQRPKIHSRRRFAVAMVLCILLVGCVAVSEPDYHLYNGNWWEFFPGAYGLANIFHFEPEQTATAAEKLGITLPDTLGGNPVIDFWKFNLTTKKVLIQFAWMSPRYVYYSSFYGVEMEESYISADGIEGTRHWREGAEVLYGSTDDEVWRRQFGFDENDVYLASNRTLANQTLVGISAQEYEGITLYVGQIDLPSYANPSRTQWVVTWVDYKNGVVFSVSGDAETPDTLIGFAQEIIDLNQ